MKRIPNRLIVIIALLAAMYGCSNQPGTTPENPGQEPPESSHDTDYPTGVTVTSFTDELGNGDICSGYIATVDFSANGKLRFNIGYEGYKMTPTEFYSKFSPADGKPYIVINGGYFSGSTSVSLAVTDGNVRCHNAMKINWPSDQNPERTVYPVRSAFGQMEDGSFEAQWVYCVRQNFKEYYSFPSALDNNEKTETFMEKAPDTDTPGGTLWQPVEAIGGGPRLVQDGKNVAEANYWAEVLDSGGTSGLTRQPRTAIGTTADNVLIMIVCDGRGMNGSSGFTLPELADKLIALGVTDAINLDGGGSSAIVGHDGSVLNRPSDSGDSETIIERAVTTAVIISETE